MFKNNTGHNNCFCLQSGNSPAIELIDFKHGETGDVIYSLDFGRRKCKKKFFWGRFCQVDLLQPRFECNHTDYALR